MNTPTDMKYVLFICFWSFVYFVDAGPHVTLSIKPSSTVHIGDTVRILCKINGSFDRGFAVTFGHNTELVGEQCNAFNDKLHKIICSPGGVYATATNFEFKIQSVKWSDRGVWKCAHNFNSSDIHLKVISTPVMTALKPLPRKDGRVVEGAGTRTNPYNLLPTNLTQFECTTGCGYPPPNIRWSYSNKTSSGSLNDFTSGTRNNKCTGVNQEGMVRSTSIFNVKNCNEMGLYGHLKITCVVLSPEYREELSRSFYVICPGGIPALTLTHGEIIGIAVGCAMALILTFLSIIWFHRKRLKTHRQSSV